MNAEMKQIKLESVFKDAYIDRYRRLGYEVTNQTELEENGKKYTVIQFSRDRDNPTYARLAELEAEVDSLCAKAKEAAGAPDSQRAKRKIILLALFIAGLVLMAGGIGMVIGGLFAPNLVLSLTGWGVAVVGAVLMVVWSCLRESWRMRRIDVRDDAEHPGFGIDVYSRKVEECLRLADEARASAGTR
ncbi:MAG: hypothetical protein ACLSU0_00760 [Oscillospiraceae bacterium]